MIPELCIGSTRTILLEMPFEQWQTSMTEDIFSLLERGFCVVLAHIERYEPFQRNRTAWKSILALPVFKQINAGSFLKPRHLSGLITYSRIRSFCLDFLQEHPETILGTDCHNLSTRSPNLAAARSVITERLGQEILSRTDKTVCKALEL